MSITAIKYAASRDDEVELRITSYLLPDGSDVVLTRDGWTVTNGERCLALSGQWFITDDDQCKLDAFFLFDCLSEALGAWAESTV